MSKQLLLICSISFVLVSCKSVNHNCSENLLLNYKNDKYKVFVDDFPNNQLDFKYLFDYTEEREGVFYDDKGYEMINYFFSRSPKTSDYLTIVKSVEICIGLENWDADNINFFQKGTFQYVLSYPNEFISEIEKHSEKSQRKFWHFLLTSSYETENETTKQKYLVLYKTVSSLSKKQTSYIQEEYYDIYDL